jgi:hypothetical protein
MGVNPSLNPQGTDTGTVAMLLLAGNLVVFLAPSVAAALIAPGLCLAAACLSLRSVLLHKRSFGYLLGVVRALLGSALPMLVMRFAIGGLGPGRWRTRWI